MSWYALEGPCVPRPDLPSGTVTFRVTDVEGSTNRGCRPRRPDTGRGRRRDETMEHLAARLTTSELDAAFARGRAVDLEAAIGLALSDPD
jgi:hypothetical protein